MTDKERDLLHAIHSENDGEDGRPDNYPETFYEKVGYTEFCLLKLLEEISPALRRIGRLQSLQLGTSMDGISTLPDVITHNESRIAIEKLLVLEACVADAIKEMMFVFKHTKEGFSNVSMHNENV